MKEAIIWKESIYKRGYVCSCGAKLSEDGMPNDNVGMSGENMDDPRLFCMKCKNIVGKVDKCADNATPGKWYDEFSEEEEVKEFVRDRDAAILTFDVREFRKFYRKWEKKGVYGKKLPKDDEIIMLVICHMVLGMENPPEEAKKRAEEYLTSYGVDKDPFAEHETQKCYGFAVGNISPFVFGKKKRAMIAAIEEIKKLEGLLGVHPAYPDGTVLVFDTLNNAKGGRNILRSKGVVCGKEIGEVEVEKRFIK
jgi:hypothetical protein